MRKLKLEDILNEGQELHRKGELEKAEHHYNIVMNHDMTNPGLFFIMGALQAQKGNYGLGIVLLKAAVELKPDFLEAWNDMGCCFKNNHHDQSAEFCFTKCMELSPNDPDYPSNISGIYVNRGTPEKVLEWANKALAIAERFPNLKETHGVIQARWHKALALLEQQKWEEGWEYHEARLSPLSGCKPMVRNYQDQGMTPWWDGKSKGLVVIHGEQGLGDEIMFASCLPEAIKTGAEIVLECAPRVESLLQRSFPEIKVFGTHKADGKEWKGDRQVDYKLAMGTLPKFCRKKDSDFPGTPYLKPDPVKTEFYREKLSALGNRPKVGISWQGGAIKTRVDLRSLQIEQLKPILEQDCDFISLQYTVMAQAECDEFYKKTGIKIHHWEEAATGKNSMDDQAALIANLDCVVTVCQSAVHIAGGLGVRTYVMVPSKPSWRYGVIGNMPWYNSVNLIRQVGEDWNTTVQQTRDLLCLYLTTIESKTKSYMKPIVLTGRVGIAGRG